MDSLDRKIIEAVIGKSDPDLPIPNFVEKIKQAFKEQRSSEFGDWIDSHKMTGQEWYDRFENELTQLREQQQEPQPLDAIPMEAAKKASGLTKD